MGSDEATEAIPKGYDGVDACPAFCAGEASASSSVSAVVLEPRVAVAWRTRAAGLNSQPLVPSREIWKQVVEHPLP